MDNAIFEVPIGKIKPNPKNPRVIKDERYAKLLQSIKDFPEMLQKRPLICFIDTDKKYVVLGGNMRLKAATELKFKKLPIMLADDWTEEQKMEFIIKDNVGFGEWDFDMLTADWDTDQLKNWGVEFPAIMAIPELGELIGQEKNKPAVLKITFTDADQLQAAQNDIQELIDRKYPGAFFSVSAGEI